MAGGAVNWSYERSTKKTKGEKIDHENFLTNAATLISLLCLFIVIAKFNPVLGRRFTDAIRNARKRKSERSEMLEVG